LHYVLFLEGIWWAGEGSNSLICGYDYVNGYDYDWVLAVIMAKCLI